MFINIYTGMLNIVQDLESNYYDIYLWIIIMGTNLFRFFFGGGLVISRDN